MTVAGIPKLLTVAEVARMAQVSVSTVRAEIKAGHLRARRIRGCVRVSEIEYRGVGRARGRGVVTIRMGVCFPATPEEASVKMRAFLASLPQPTEEERQRWVEHGRRVRSKWRPKPGDTRRYPSTQTVDSLSDPRTAT